MNENKLSRKWNLASIREWLVLAQTPLLHSQQVVAKALGELCQNHDTEGMIGGTDIAHAINTAVVWAMHAMDLVELALTQLEAPSEPTLPSEKPKLPLLYCDSCKRAFCADYGVEPGDDCPFCSEGHICGLFSEPEKLPLPSHYCNRCEKTFRPGYGIEPGEPCPYCELGTVTDANSQPVDAEPQIDKDKL